MANNIVYTGTYTPYSYESIVKPLRDLTTLHAETSEALGKLKGSSESLSFLQNSANPDDLALYNEVTSFQGNISSVIDSIASGGMNNGFNLNKALQAKRDYATKIKPIQDAVTSVANTNKMIAEAQIKDPTTIVKYKANSVTDYLRNPLRQQEMLSGIAISDQAYKTMLPIAKQHLNDLASVVRSTMEGDAGEFIAFIQQPGITVDQLSSYLHSKGAKGLPILKYIEDVVYDSLNLSDEWKDSEEQIRANIRRGLSSGIGATQAQVSPMPKDPLNGLGAYGSGTGDNDTLAMGANPELMKYGNVDDEYVKKVESNAKRLGITDLRRDARIEGSRLKLSGNNWDIINTLGEGLDVFDRGMTNTEFAEYNKAGYNHSLVPDTKAINLRVGNLSQDAINKLKLVKGTNSIYNKSEFINNRHNIDVVKKYNGYKTDKEAMNVLTMLHDTINNGIVDRDISGEAIMKNLQDKVEYGSGVKIYAYNLNYADPNVAVSKLLKGSIKDGKISTTVLTSPGTNKKAKKVETKELPLEDFFELDKDNRPTKVRQGVNILFNMDEHNEGIIIDSSFTNSKAYVPLSKVMEFTGVNIPVKEYRENIKAMQPIHDYAKRNNVSVEQALQALSTTAEGYQLANQYTFAKHYLDEQLKKIFITLGAILNTQVKGRNTNI